MQFWYVECEGKIRITSKEIMRVLHERFHHFTHDYAIGFKFTQLRMQNGQWEAANRQFNTPLAQASWKTLVDLFHTYFRMLTPEYRAEVFLLMQKLTPRLWKSAERGPLRS